MVFISFMIKLKMPVNFFFFKALCLKNCKSFLYKKKSNKIAIQRSFFVNKKAIIHLQKETLRFFLCYKFFAITLKIAPFFFESLIKLFFNIFFINLLLSFIFCAYFFILKIKNVVICLKKKKNFKF